MWASLAGATSRLITQRDTKQAPSQILALPAELRNLIYELIIATHETRAQPNFVNACRQTRTEALDLFYGTHRFLFGPGALLPHHLHWLEVIGEARVDCIRFVRGVVKMYDSSQPVGQRVTAASLEIEIRDNGSREKALVPRFLDNDVRKRCGAKMRATIAQNWETLLRTGPSQSRASWTVKIAIQEMSNYAHIM
ncbi:hypothetical protein LTR56_008759 [Elasticomyces elasticus]|nr:hypothetical protein LTR22_017544 [Elasticomyces elasticus]KAK3646141.1 hypothetical protein LTR56_008759 [Elasticomyces elasticus]KAK4924322.1 hypothetical protein LTR49_008623 [Elasticomyces elasticus]KAK5759120.1 hypothetical protein LTS12_010728 [Elasticomyces elasticus]